MHKCSQELNGSGAAAILEDFHESINPKKKQNPKFP
jgi:hypothetical protein